MAALKLLRGGAREPSCSPAALGMRFGGRAAGRARLRLQPLDGHLGLVADDERLGLPALALPARPSCCVRRPGPLPFAGLAVRGGLQCFGGHPASCFQILGFAVAVLGACGCWSPASCAPAAGAAACVVFGGALVAGTALAAVHAASRSSSCSRTRSTSAPARATLATVAPAARYLLGVFLHDYWGRATRTPLEFPSALEEHAYYVGALPLMLAVAALVCGRRRRAGGGRRGWASLALAVATGHPAALRPRHGAARLRAAHNGRLAVVVVLVRRAAGRLGARRADGAARDPAAAAVLVLALAAVLLALPVVVMAAGGALDPGALRLGAARGLGLHRPTPAARARHAPAASRTLIRLASLLEWLVLARRRAGAARAAAARAARRPAFVAPRRAAGRARPVQGRHGLQPGDPGRHAEQPATRRDPLPAGPAAGALRRARRRRRRSGARGRCRRTWRCATASTTRAATTIPSRSATPSSGARATSPQPGCLYAFCPESAGAAARGAARARPVRRHPPAPEPARRAAARARAADRVRRAATRASTPTRTRSRAPSSSTARTWSPDDSAALRGRHLPGFQRAHRGRHRGARSPGLSRRRGRGATGPRPRPHHHATSPSAWSSTRRAAAPRCSCSPTAAIRAGRPPWTARTRPIHRVDYLLRGVSVPPATTGSSFAISPPAGGAGWIVSLVALLGIGGAAAVGCAGGWVSARDEGVGRDELGGAPAPAAAALLYLGLSLLMFAPAFGPGRTLSASDYLWSAPPWESMPPGRGCPAWAPTGSRRTPRASSSRRLQATRAALPGIPRWDPYILERRLVPRRSAVRRVLAVQRAGVRAALLEVAGGDRGPEAVRGRARRLPAREGARHALWGRVPDRARFRFQPLVRDLGVLAAHERLGVPALALPVQRAVRAAARSSALRGAGGAVGLSLVGGHPASSYQVLAVLVVFWVGACPGLAVAARPARPAPGHVRPRARDRRGAGRRRADPVRGATRALERCHGPRGGLGPAPPAVALPARDLPLRLLGTRCHEPSVRDRTRGARLLHRGAAAHAGGRGARHPALSRANCRLRRGRGRPRGVHRPVAAVRPRGSAARLRRDQQRPLRGRHGAVLRRAGRMGSRRPDRQGTQGPPSRRRARSRHGTPRAAGRDRRGRPRVRVSARWGRRCAWPRDSRTPSLARRP